MIPQAVKIVGIAMRGPIHRKSKLEGSSATM